MLGLYGLPALRFLTTDDQEERLMLTALANRCLELDDIRQQNLAVKIINELGRAWPR
jgi:hypothetical protein